MSYEVLGALQLLALIALYALARFIMHTPKAPPSAHIVRSTSDDETPRLRIASTSPEEPSAPL